MRKLVILPIVLLLAAAPIFGQNISYADMEQDFGAFADDVAQALPFAAATTGLTWSDASVKGFPHFGVGVSVSAVTLPKEAFENVLSSLNGFTLPSEIGSLGVPLPGYALDARLGLPVLPFDVGAKFGYMTPEMGSALEGATGISAEYLLAGLEVRYPILKGNLLLPALSVGAGYSYLNGAVAMEASGMTTAINLPNSYTVNLDNPDVQFAWKTHTIDLEVQASKGLLFLTPYIGAGYSYGWSQAGGGVSSELTQTDKDNLALYDIEVDDQGFLIYKDANGGALRGFGGVSFNLFILKLDVNAQYNFMSKSFGGGINARIQI